MAHKAFRQWRQTMLLTGLRRLGPLLPSVAGRVAFEIFGRPRRPQVGAGDRRFLATATPLTIPWEGEQLAGYSWGAGPTVLLVHGWESYAARMRSFVGPLVRAGFRVVAFDAPAHGASPGQHTHLPAWVSAIKAAVATVGPVAGIVAHSFGGAATLMALGEGGLAVGRVVVNGAPAELEMMVTRFAQGLSLPPTVAEGLRQEILRRFGRPVSAFSAPRVIAGLQVPGLLIHDRTDSVVPFASGEAIAAAWQGATFLPTEGLDHRGALEDRTILRQVVAFLREGQPDLMVEAEVLQEVA